MIRPAEYENLIKIKSFDEVAETLGATEALLNNASGFQKAATAVPEDLHMQKFTMAYEGYFQLVQAVLEFYQVRTRESGRNLAIQRVSTSLGLSPQEFAFVTKAHERRNEKSYKSPFPPISSAEASAMLGILEKYLPIARELTTRK